MDSLKDFIRDNNILAGGIMIAVGVAIIIVNFVLGTAMVHTIINCVLGAAIIIFGLVLAIKGVQ